MGQVPAQARSRHHHGVHEERFRLRASSALHGIAEAPPPTLRTPETRNRLYASRVHGAAAAPECGAGCPWPWPRLCRLLSS